MIVTRPAAADDQAVIRRMILAARLDPTTLNWRNFLLAVDDASGAIVGCAQIKRYRDCDEFGSLVVLPGQRGQGIGARLLRELVERERGPVHLVCVERMAAYYERFGFRRITIAESPRTLKLKQLVPRLFGVRIVCMRRSASSAPTAAG